MRSRSSFIPSLINISLVLFFLGVFFFLGIAGNIVVRAAIEGLEMKIILSDYAGQTDINRMISDLKKQPYLTDVRFVSKEEALVQFKEMGEDFLAAMDGANPLPGSIVLKIRAEYASVENVQKITAKILENGEVVEIYYPVRLFRKIEENSVQLKIIALILGSGLVIVSLFLIINTVKLSIFSRRLIIRSMQLVGATNSFIRRPFLYKGILQGLLGGIIASGLLFAALYAISHFLFDISIILLSLELYILMASLVVFGAIIGWFSSWIAVNRFLDKQLNEII